MNTKSNKRTLILVCLLIVLVFVTFRVNFNSNINENYIIDEADSFESDIINILKYVDNIDFDTTVVSDKNFQSLKSIDRPIPNLPVGKNDPFVGI